MRGEVSESAEIYSGWELKIVFMTHCQWEEEKKNGTKYGIWELDRAKSTKCAIWELWDMDKSGTKYSITELGMDSMLEITRGGS